MGMARGKMKTLAPGALGGSSIRTETIPGRDSW